jgi:type IV pilus assembly protein PilC
MPKYQYMARTSAGVALTGEVVARTEPDAVRLLRGEGKFVVRLSELADGAQAALLAVQAKGSRRVKPDEVIFFANQLAAMVDSGVPLADALEATIDQAPPGAFRRTIEDVIGRVQAGSDLSAALAAHPRVFVPLFIHMVRASETTGTLGAMLIRIADYLSTQHETLKKVKGALAYPLVMVLFSIAATSFLLTYVLPKFASIYAGKRAILPLPTRILMGTSDWIVTHWMWLIAGIVVAIISGLVYFRSDRGRYTADWLRLNIPVIGPMFRKACLARMLRTLGAMIAAGVSVLDAVLITRDVVGNRLFGDSLEKAHDRLERGEQLSQALQDAPYLPRPIWQMLHAGERSGQLGPAMERVAALCESDLATGVRTMTQFIEPAMIVVVGAMVGGIAIAMLLPIFQISKIMAH